MDEKGDFDITQPRLSGIDFEEFIPEKPVVDEQVIPPEEPEPAPSEPGELHKLDILSDSYVGRWQRLVSSTNWQKGRIILEWRGALMTENDPVAGYSDEA